MNARSHTAPMFKNNLTRILLLATCTACFGVHATPGNGSDTPYTTALINIEARDAADLSGQWRYIVDPLKMGVTRADSRRYAVFEDTRGPEDQMDLIEYNFDTSPLMTVPGDWNGQDATLTWYDGLVWYRRTLDLGEPATGRSFLHFGAANYRALVYVNGEKAGEHEGGFTPFAFDVTDQLVQGRNVIVVGVDSEHESHSLPTPVVDWKNYGGITRPVQLVNVPDTYVHDYFVRLDAGDLRVTVRLAGAACSQSEVRVDIPELGTGLRGETGGDCSAELAAGAPQDLRRWSPDEPKLYEVRISGAGDAVTDSIGFRTIAVDGNRILLNGEPVFLRGISLHEETLGVTPSRAFNEGSARALLGIAKHDLHANFVRLAHYPHAAVITRMADEMGLLVWSEIPVYWDIDFGNSATLEIARHMQRENIVRDRNRASIMFWSVANETPKTDERLAFLGELISDARKLDGTRLITAALHQVRSEGRTFVVDDPLAELIDAVAVNTYQGWYGRAPLQRVPENNWQNPTGKPFLFSEFGAGALHGFHDPGMEKFSEEFQAAYYRVTIEMARKVPALAGASPWILKDFQSPRRLHGGYQDFWNRKGLLSPEGNRKAAFDVLAGWYRELETAGESEH
jgi:beta-glucuronidase